MENKYELSKILSDALEMWEIYTDEKTIKDFEIYKDILVEYNKHTNLTAIKDEREIYIKHFIDSISTFKALEFLRSKYNFDIESASFIDVGAGAGFPSMPLKIVNRNLNITIIDSLGKRIKFLNSVSEKLNLKNIEILHKRAEDFAREKNKRENYDIALSRAVANLPVLLEYSLPFVKVGGFMLCLKGPLVHEEITKSGAALKILGGNIVDVMSVKIPFSDLNHKIVIIEKIKSTDKKYPRKAGVPGKDPL